MDPFVGQLGLFGFNYAPQGWLSCNGQLVPISEYEVLFALIGTTYGGDGQNTFALPDLQGRASFGAGQSQLGPFYSIGQKAGSEYVTLIQQNLPTHTHLIQAQSAPASSSTPSANVPATGPKIYGAGPASSPMTDVISIAGANNPHENRQPFLALNWCICWAGIYPPPS